MMIEQLEPSKTLGKIPDAPQLASWEQSRRTTFDRARMMGMAAGSESNGTWTQLPSPSMETGSESNGIWIQLPSPPTTAAAAAAAAVAAA
eukprot:CAMPEP_0182522448 /NCGR_PEP_ID=MMETSP1323-20130603/307_1 /TAXON_ID=236787 /ORGANISM="Florenciella parvula, Strain RCC1693" /LENGTH=89 /DNA_ID=CAMNT_0024730577 /DNA_START=433 /DNA_END=699 /DNA_ORIENTATION=+